MNYKSITSRSFTASYKAIACICLLSSALSTLAQAPPPPRTTINKLNIDTPGSRFMLAPGSIDMDSIKRIDALPGDISAFIAKKPHYADTTGKLAEITEIIRFAKIGVYMGIDKNYTQALVRSEELYKLRHQVDKVLIVKHERKMYLQKNGKNVKIFNIALGPNPVGQKEYEGDGKTPEGKYTLDWTKWAGNTQSSYHISYPNAEDIARAKRKGLTPGSNIMIHGTPSPKKKKDWTNGCVALTNADLAVFRKMVFQDTAVEIVK